ncbi:MAG: hypothetical protein V1799_07670 [bacterium]
MRMINGYVQVGKVGKNHVELLESGDKIVLFDLLQAQIVVSKAKEQYPSDLVGIVVDRAVLDSECPEPDEKQCCLLVPISILEQLGAVESTDLFEYRCSMIMN